ncbi:MAG: hypothetical protein RIS64_1938 [Bacteroidota bacterium]|jgi:CRISPR-associated protein Cmr5
MPETHIKGIEQGRAKTAYTFAEDGSKMDKTKRKEYKSYVKKLPMLIKTNGLGAALAFAFSKGSQNGIPQDNKAWGKLYKQLEGWMQADPKRLIEFEPNCFVSTLMETDSATYRAVTVEILALLNWMRRFVDALIEGESTE